MFHETRTEKDCRRPCFSGDIWTDSSYKATVPADSTVERLDEGQTRSPYPDYSTTTSAATLVRPISARCLWWVKTIGCTRSPIAARAARPFAARSSSKLANK